MARLFRKTIWERDELTVNFAIFESILKLVFFMQPRAVKMQRDAKYASVKFAGFRHVKK